jgi:predicted dithiol-disulfide oxidoreductase (DUF899 family)
MTHLTYPNETGDYRTARHALLAEEMALRKQIETVAALRRALPLGGEDDIRGAWAIQTEAGVLSSQDGIFALNFRVRAASVVNHLISKFVPVRKRSIHVGGRTEKSIL